MGGGKTPPPAERQKGIDKMKMALLTREIKEQIMQDYKNPENKVAAVRAKWKLSSKQMTALIEEMGGEFRQPKSHHPKSVVKSKVKVCPNCRKKIELAGARYCPYCATDIRSEAELLKEDVQKLYSKVKYLPASDADEAGAIICRVLDYLRKETQK